MPPENPREVPDCTISKERFLPSRICLVFFGPHLRASKCIPACLKLLARCLFPACCLSARLDTDWLAGSQGALGSLWGYIWELCGGYLGTSSDFGRRLGSLQGCLELEMLAGLPEVSLAVAGGKGKVVVVSFCSVRAMWLVSALPRKAGSRHVRGPLEIVSKGP